ncbi:hypothetical protein M514_18491, partial [Trichuris suis]
LSEAIEDPYGDTTANLTGENGSDKLKKEKQNSTAIEAGATRHQTMSQYNEAVLAEAKSQGELLIDSIRHQRHQSCRSFASHCPARIARRSRQLPMDTCPKRQADKRWKCVAAEAAPSLSLRDVHPQATNGLSSVMSHLVPRSSTCVSGGIVRFTSFKCSCTLLKLYGSTKKRELKCKKALFGHENRPTRPIRQGQPINPRLTPATASP